MQDGVFLVDFCIPRSSFLIPHCILCAFFIAIIGCTHGGRPAAKVETPPVITTKSGIEMVVIPAGSFEMGNKKGRDDEKPVHTVWIDSFLMDKTEATQGEWDRLAHGADDPKPNPSNFKGPTLPVNQVKWLDAVWFCNARSKAEGLKPCYNDEGVCDFDAEGYRLPTEAEWEYACRAGTSTSYSFGNDPKKLGDHAWFTENSGKTTHPVAQKRPNPWGLCDMHGNVSEWCHDVYAKDYYEGSPDKNPRGPKEGKLYVRRGGAWQADADALRSTYRVGDYPGFGDACLAPEAIGFRCVRRAPAK